MHKKTYTAVLCDDESSLLDLLQNSVEWEKMQIDIVGTAKDGQTSVEKIITEQPDFAIIDINMPIYNGIEVIRRVRIYQEKTQFIILSGYDDFEYARNAMRYGVRYYLLKPLKMTDLFEAIYALTSVVDKNENIETSSELRDHILSIALESLILGKRTKFEDIDSIIRNFDLPIKNSNSFVIVYRPLTSQSQSLDIKNKLLEAKARLEEDKKNPPCVFFLHQEDLIVICNSSETKILGIAEQQLKTIENILKIPILCGVGKEINNLNNCNFSYNKALLAMEAYFYNQNQHLFSFYDLCLSYPPKINMRKNALLFCNLIQNENINNQDIQNAVNKFLNKIVFANNAPTSYVTSMCHLLFQEINIKFQEETQCDLTNILDCESFFNVKSFQELRQLLINSVEEAFIYYRAMYFYTRYNLEEFKTSTEDPIIMKALNLIEDNCTLSIENVAEELHFSPAYFAIYFKNKTDINLSDFLFDRKMLLARKLLLQNQLSIFEISEELAYNDYRSFSRAFKKYHDLSPSQFSRFYRYERQE